MGNPKSGQTTHRLPSNSDPDAESAGVAGQAQFPSPPISVEPEFTSGLIASLYPKAAIPTSVSLQPEVGATPFAPDDDCDTFYDALGSHDHQQPGHESHSGEKVQQPRTRPSVDTTIVDDDAFYDAPTVPEDEVVPVHPSRRPHRPESEGLSKCIAGGPTGRGCSSRVCASEPPNAANPNTSPPATSAPGRGASPPVTASPPIGSPPVSEPHVPRRKGLMMGMNYLKSNLPLKHAVKDAVEFGEALGDVLGFNWEDLIFVVDGKRASPPAVGLGSKPSRGIRSQSLSGEAQWKGQMHFENNKRLIYPTRWNMIEGFRWLIRGAKEGDHLVWLFSGHCSYFGGEGPYLVTADIGNTKVINPKDFDPKNAISKNDIRDELLLKVPRGCRLDIFLDCCYSSALLDLQYCIGHMNPKEMLQKGEVSIKTTQTLQLHATPKPSQTSAPVITTGDVKQTLTSEHRRGSIHSSLYGSEQIPHTEELPEAVVGVLEHRPALTVQAREPIPASVANDPSPPAQPITSTASPPIRKMPKRTNCVAAAPPLPPTPLPSQTSSWFPNWPKATTTPAPELTNEGAEVKHSASSQFKRIKHGVIEAPRPPDHFMERKGNFDRPEGYVTMWAAAGRFQSAFEASEPVEHGILTNVLCQALGTHEEITARELWARIWSALRLENEIRIRRDQKKERNDREDPRRRIQNAELWVSHPELFFTSIGPVVDRRAFPVVPGLQPEPTAASAMWGHDSIFTS